MNLALDIQSLLTALLFVLLAPDVINAKKVYIGIQ